MKTYLTTLMFILTSSSSFAKESPTDSDKDDAAVSHEIYFNTDSHSIKKEEFNKLTEFLKSIETMDIDRISIHGFCDDRGSYDYNLELSNKRAKTIKEIIAKYINANNASKLVIVGKGEIDLLSEEKKLFNELRSLNRKVIVVVSPIKLIAGSFFGADLKVGKTYNLKAIKFKKGLKHIIKESIQDLKDLSAYLTRNKGIYFTIQGHVCCTTGGADSRDKETGKRNLSEARAKFIRDYLIKRGVNPSRIKYQGLKGTHNLGKSQEEDRRIELLIRAL